MDSPAPYYSPSSSHRHGGRVLGRGDHQGGHEQRHESRVLGRGNRHFRASVEGAEGSKAPMEGLRFGQVRMLPLWPRGAARRSASTTAWRMCGRAEPTMAWQGRARPGSGRPQSARARPWARPGDVQSRPSDHWRDAGTTRQGGRSRSTRRSLCGLMLSAEMSDCLLSSFISLAAIINSLYYTIFAP